MTTCFEFLFVIKSVIIILRYLNKLTGTRPRSTRRPEGTGPEEGSPFLALEGSLHPAPVGSRELLLELGDSQRLERGDSPLGLQVGRTLALLGSHRPVLQVGSLQADIRLRPPLGRLVLRRGKLVQAGSLGLQLADMRQEGSLQQVGLEHSQQGRLREGIPELV